MKKKDMTEDQFRKRRAELLLAEFQQPERWVYMSFAEDKFLGAIVLQAHGIIDAVTRAHSLLINPGGQVVVREVPDDELSKVPDSSRYRLLSEEEVRQIWPDAKSIKEYEDQAVS